MAKTLYSFYTTDLLTTSGGSVTITDVVPVNGAASVAASFTDETLVFENEDWSIRELCIGSASGWTLTLSYRWLDNSTSISEVTANKQEWPARTRVYLTYAAFDVAWSYNAFGNIAVSWQSTVIADSTMDTLTLVAWTNITITTNATTDTITISSSASSWSTFWTAVPWTPTRSSNTVFTITDTSNTNLYNQLLQRGTILKRTDSTTKQAMVVSATYATNTVTVTIVGDALGVWFSAMKYGMEKARVLKFAIAGSIASTGTNLSNTQMIEEPAKIFGVDMRAWTAGNGTTTADINKWWTTMFTTKPSITSTNQSITWVTADDGTTATTGDFITIDIDAVAVTTKVTDLYVNLYRTPLYNANLT